MPLLYAPAMAEPRKDLDRRQRAAEPQLDERSTTALADLESFEAMILQVIREAGLPTDGILVDLGQRLTFMDTAGRALHKLDLEQRGKASYISKMIIAGSCGLFDAALNYLWDETVNELRRRVVNYDLEYFYSVAEASEARRKDLKGPEDLDKLDDQKLLTGAREIGLISDIGFKELDHIRFMRNYASAAHPNQSELDGIQLASWLSLCIRYAMTLEDNVVAATVKKLLVNIKARRMENDDIRDMSAFFKNLSQQQADTLAAGMLGIYTNLVSTPETLDNIRRLWSKLWEFVSEPARNNIGFRLGSFKATGDADYAERVRQLIDLVGAAAYLPQEMREVEVNEALDDLLAAHYEWHNFYNEVPIARRLAELVGQLGSVPASLTDKYVLSVVEVFLTNGNGTAWNAEPYYQELIGKFDPEQASIALRSFTDPDIAAKLQRPLGREHWDRLLALIEDKLIGRPDRELLAAIRDFTGPQDKLAADAGIKRLLEQGH